MMVLSGGATAVAPGFLARIGLGWLSLPVFDFDWGSARPLVPRTRPRSSRTGWETSGGRGISFDLVAGASKAR
jgi:hypothetical protein